MISDFLQYLEYYCMVCSPPALPYDDPLIRIEYDAVDKTGNLVLALLTPYAHTINTLCYREPEFESHYNQKNIAEICRVSPAEVSAWKKEIRIPEKYHWFLLLVDISEKCGNVYGHKLLHGEAQAVEAVCDGYLRMIKCCWDPFCRDDCILSDAVRQAYGIEKAISELRAVNPVFWNRLLKLNDI